MRHRRPLAILLLALAFVLIAGDGGWWHRDWWRGAVRRQIDALTPPPPLADMSGPACLQALAASGAGYTRIADFTQEPGCAVSAAVRVQTLGGVGLSAPFAAACPLALALQRHVSETVAPAAERTLGSQLARIDHVGSFACRRVRGRPGGPLSQHAFARALDVTGFALADGRTVSVKADWGDPGSPEGHFLRAISARRGPFSTVITPDDNALHHDHFHFGLRRPAAG